MGQYGPVMDKLFEEKAAEYAKSMIKEGLSLETISRILELPVETVEEIAKKMQ